MGFNKLRWPVERSFAWLHDSKRLRSAANAHWFSHADTGSRSVGPATEHSRVRPRTAECSRVQPKRVTAIDFAFGMGVQHTKGGDMWKEIGMTFRAAMKDWGTTARLCVLVAVLAISAAAVTWIASAR